MCDIQIKPDSYGWNYVDVKIGEDQHKFTISGALRDSIGEMITALYCFLDIEDPACFCPDFMDRIEFELSKADLDYLNRAEPCSVDMLYIAKFYWDEEGSFTEWILEKPLTIQRDFMLKIKILFSKGDDRKQFTYEIDFRKFCYAWAKAFTEVLKTTGICGYYNATWNADFKPEQFLLVKAFALDRLEELRYAAPSEFQKELELLIQDM